jgi:Kdo2-lipid IVA lauroyltransferase/acyltransferase
MPFTAALLLSVLRRFATLPVSVLRRIARFFGLVVYLVSANNRDTIDSNLSQAGVKLSVFSVTQAIAKSAVDMLWVWFHSPAQVAAKITVSPSDAAIVATALSGTHATILLTPHLGCFEALAKWIAHQTPLTAMYRRPNRAWVASFIESARTLPNLTMARADASGVRLALKTLKAGGLLGILPDQVPKQGEGIWLPWFGREAYTITLPAKLHLATQARVFIICAIPTKTGWEVLCEPVNMSENMSENVSEGSDAASLTGVLNAALERTVLRAPLNYAWSYKRYKTVANT